MCQSCAFETIWVKSNHPNSKHKGGYQFPLAIHCLDWMSSCVRTSDAGQAQVAWALWPCLGPVSWKVIWWNSIKLKYAWKYSGMPSSAKSPQCQMQICYCYNDFDTFWPELTNRNDAHSLVVKDDNKQLRPLCKDLVRTLTCALNWATAQARKLDKYKYKYPCGCWMVLEYLYTSPALHRDFVYTVIPSFFVKSAQKMNIVRVQSEAPKNPQSWANFATRFSCSWKASWS